MTRQVVPKLSIQGQFKSHSGPESRVWEQPDVAPCTTVVTTVVAVGLYNEYRLEAKTLDTNKHF